LCCKWTEGTSVAERHAIDAAPILAPEENFDAATAPTVPSPAPTLLLSKLKIDQEKKKKLNEVL
jgi:hypothetical protein